MQPTISEETARELYKLAFPGVNDGVTRGCGYFDVLDPRPLRQLIEVIFVNPIQPVTIIFDLSRQTPEPGVPTVGGGGSM